MMYLPFTPVMADMLRAIIGLAARAAALDMVESIVVVVLGFRQKSSVISLRKRKWFRGCKLTA